MTDKEIKEIVDDWVSSAQKLTLYPHSRIVDSLTIGAAEDVLRLSNEIRRLKCLMLLKEKADYSILGDK